jgi:hypothetical protein
VYRGNYGIYKRRLSPLSTDAESEVAVYLLARRLGVPCGPALPADKDTIFSVFRYDFAREYLVHFRHLFDGPRSANEYANLVAIRPQYKELVRIYLKDRGFALREQGVGDEEILSGLLVRVSWIYGNWVCCQGWNGSWLRQDHTSWHRGRLSQRTDR